VIVPAVPPGKYRLLIEPTMDPPNPELPFFIGVRRDVMVWSNVWLGFLGLMAYPIYRWMRLSSFESSRWAMSDFSPSNAADDEDDE
jgi:hypothetical protein